MSNYILGLGGKCCGSCTPNDPCLGTPAISVCGSGSGYVGVFGSWSAFSVGSNLTGATWSATGLPSGISINSSTGYLSGTPTAAATTTITVTATNGCGYASCGFVLTITTPTGVCNTTYGDNGNSSGSNNCGSPVCFDSGCAPVSAFTLYIKFDVTSADPVSFRFYRDGVLRFDTGAITGTVRYTHSVPNGAVHSCMEVYGTGTFTEWGYAVTCYYV